MEKRPRITLKLTTIDILLEIIGWSLLAFLWFLTLSEYSRLPQTIATHFNSSGKIDDYGNKDTIFLLPIITTVMFVGLTILNRFPHLFNYATEITEENAERQYKNATKLLRFLKLSIVLIFTFIAYRTQEIAKGNAVDLGKWFLPVAIALVQIPLFYFLIQSFKNEK